MSRDEEREARLRERERLRAARAEGQERGGRRRSPWPVWAGSAAGLVVVALIAAVALGGGRKGDQVTPARARTVRARTVAHTGAAKPAGTTAGSGIALDATAPGGTADPRHPSTWPLHGRAARARRVPILMYHLIAAAPAGTAYPGLWVPPDELADQVQGLHDAGFEGVSLGEVWAAWHGTGHLPLHPIVLSFDDGDLSQVMGAGPVLEKAGWPGVLNLAVSHLGKGGIPTWGAKRLIRQGWEIDSHTIDHLDVTTLSTAELHHELSGSKAAIKSRLGVDAKFFCYPAGRNDATSQAAARAAGYAAATTTVPGLASASGDPFTLPRIRVEPGTSPATLVNQAAGVAAAPVGSGE